MQPATPLTVRFILRQMALVVLLLPFVLLSLMAQGTMVIRAPGPDSFMMVLCGEHVPVAMVIDDGGNVIPADEYAASDQDPIPAKPKQPCDWAMLGQVALADPGQAMPVPGLAFRAADLAEDLPAQILRAEVLAPSARGPPQS